MRLTRIDDAALQALEQYVERFDEVARLLPEVFGALRELREFAGVSQAELTKTLDAPIGFIEQNRQPRQVGLSISEAQRVLLWMADTATDMAKAAHQSQLELGAPET